MELLVIYIAVALGVSFLCSILEAVLLSITPSYLAAGTAKGSRTAVKLTRLKGNVDRPLSAILTLNTIAHTVGATGAGAQALEVFGESSIAIFSAVLTLAILILSEIIPKTLGATYWKAFAPLAAGLLPPMIFFLKPFVWGSEKITKTLRSEEKGGTISLDELRALSEIGYQEGLLEPQEVHILRHFLQFSTLDVQAIMTPRTVTFVLPTEWTVAKTLATYPELQFSRIPIYQDDEDHIVGYVLKSDIYSAYFRGEQDKPLEQLKRKALTATSRSSVKSVFKLFMTQHEQMGVVTNSYGLFVGIVTLEDVIEAMIGLEIKDEGDTVIDLQEHAKELWRKKAQKYGWTENVQLQTPNFGEVPDDESSD